MNARCSKCGAEPRLPGQSWGRTCFASYRRQQRAGNQKARGEPGAPQDRAAAPAQGGGDGQADGEPGFPAVVVKVHPYGVLLRFRREALDPADAQVLAKLQPGVFHSAHVWLEPRRRLR